MTTLSRYTLVVLAIGLTTPVRTSAQKSPSYTAADVRFMQGMIGHHAQALAMVSLIPTRSSRQDIRMLGQRIQVSQKDEIAMMQQWLRDRHQQVPARDAQPGGQTMAGNSMNMTGMTMADTLMPGMLTSEQLAKLAKTTGDDFDKLFLADMIRHHEGALVMVKSLLGTTGSGQEAEVFRFASEVDSDQRAEIARMNALFDTLGGSGAKTQH
jgi:uncharacterized protein (DUF305 family)